jgi:hypothetical protein
MSPYFKYITYLTSRFTLFKSPVSLWLGLEATLLTVFLGAFIMSFSKFLYIFKQVVLGRNNRLLSFDTTRTA